MSILYYARHNWAESYAETWQWRTDVLQSYNGTMTRRAVLAVPRCTVEWTALLPDALRPIVQSHIATRTHELGWIPIWCDAVGIRASAGDTTATVSTSGRRFAVGDRVIFSADARDVQEATVTAVTATSLSWSPALARSVAGIAVPVTQGRITRASGRLHTVSAETVRIAAELAYGPVPASRLIADVLPTYLGREVYAYAPHEDGRTTEIDRRVDVADAGLGAWRAYPTHEAARLRHEYRWVGSRDDVAKASWFLAQCRGAWRWWWWDTLARDIACHATVTAASTTIAVDESLVAMYGVTPPVWRRDVSIRVGGTVQRRRITSWTPTSITVDAPLGVAGEVERISWLQPSRWADSVQWEWVTPELCRASSAIDSVLGTRD